MATFDFAQLEGLAAGAGVATQLVPTMAAIALAESDGCQYALAGPRDVRPVKECVYRQTSGEQSYGLWQINIGVGSPAQLGLFDPRANAEAMFNKLRIQGLSAWTTYTNGAYRKHLPSGALPAPVPFQPAPAASVPRNFGRIAAPWSQLVHSLAAQRTTNANLRRIAASIRTLVR